jgi:LEA14-like dessication related protein
MLPALAAAAPAAPPPAPVITGFRVGKIDNAGVDIALRLAPKAAGKCAGPYRGDLSFFDASPGLKIAGSLAAIPGGCELPASLPWKVWTAEAVQGVHGDLLKVRFRGELTEGRKARKVDWAGSVARDAVQLAEPMAASLRRFARATDIQLGGLGLNTTTVNAEVVVRSPLAFHLRVMQVRCQLEVDGVVIATGALDNFVVFGGRPNPIRIPVTLDNRATLVAAGNSLARGGRAEGRLVGVARLRFPAGDVEFPVEFPVQVALR